MTRSSLVFGDPNKSGYPQIDHFHGIWRGKFLAKKMEARHDREVVERKKLQPVQPKTPGHQKRLITLESLERCRMTEIDHMLDILPENSSTN